MLHFACLSITILLQIPDCDQLLLENAKLHQRIDQLENENRELKSRLKQPSDQPVQLREFSTVQSILAAVPPDKWPPKENGRWQELFSSSLNQWLEQNIAGSKLVTTAPVQGAKSLVGDSGYHFAVMHRSFDFRYFHCQPMITAHFPKMNTDEFVRLKEGRSYRLQGLINVIYIDGGFSFGSQKLDITITIRLSDCRLVL